MSNFGPELLRNQKSWAQATKVVPMENLVETLLLKTRRWAFVGKTSEISFQVSPRGGSVLSRVSVYQVYKYKHTTEVIQY